MSTQSNLAARTRKAISARFPHLAALGKANAPKPPVRSEAKRPQKIAATGSRPSEPASRFAHLRTVAMTIPATQEPAETPQREARRLASSILAAARAAGLKL